MPIYAYRCASCGHAKDVLQKLSDAPLTLCPSCGAAAFAKQVTAAGFQLKGSGWYATDFKSNPAKKADSTDGAQTDGVKTDAAKPDTAGAESPKTDTPKPGDSTAPAKTGDSTSSPSAPAATKAAGGAAP
jgi:putative FmdB family regulatory protein